MAQQGVISLIRTNIGTLLEVIDSVWLIVKQNLNILTSITGTLSSIIMGGGSAVIEFLLNTVFENKLNDYFISILSFSFSAFVVGRILFGTILFAQQ